MIKMKMINIHSNNESVCPHVCMWHVMMMTTCNSQSKRNEIDHVHTPARNLNEYNKHTDVFFLFELYLFDLAFV